MKLSERMRDMVTPPFPEGTNFIGVGHKTVLTWATEVAALEAQVARLNAEKSETECVMDEIAHSLNHALSALEALDA